MSLPVKSIFGNEIRRLTLGEAKFELLRKYVCEAYNISNFSVQYTDDDGDLVSISSDCELAEAFNIVKPGTLKVIVASQVPPIPQQVILEQEQEELQLQLQELQGKPLPVLGEPLPAKQGEPLPEQEPQGEPLPESPIFPESLVFEPQTEEEGEPKGEPLVGEAAEQKKGWAVSKIKHASTVVQQTYHQLMSPPLFVRCPHCIRTLAVPPPAAPLTEGQAQDEDEDAIPLPLRAPVPPPVDRRVMACPHCNGVFRVPSTVAWEQIVYISARLRLAVVAFWDNARNGFSYLFRNQPDDAQQRSRAVQAAVTTKVWTEKKIGALYEVIRRKSMRVPGELHEDDVVSLHHGDQDVEEGVGAEPRPAEANVADAAEAEAAINPEEINPEEPAPEAAEAEQEAAEVEEARESEAEVEEVEEAAVEVEEVKEEARESKAATVEEVEAVKVEEVEEVKEEARESKAATVEEVEAVKVEEVEEEEEAEAEAEAEVEEARDYDTDLLTLASMGFLNSGRNLQLLKANGLQQTINILLN